jgi:hypothetical protein
MKRGTRGSKAHNGDRSGTKFAASSVEEAVTRKESMMGLKKLFAKEIYIRFNEAESGFICSVEVGGFRIKSQEYLLEARPASVAGSRENLSASSPSGD